ncbi:hypothetical protein WS61_08275 [Burkholderia sp. ABCPW 11]|nr:hypothetical protein WS61_08275 [Burkholderia sp. ABCPW 11]
MAADAGRDRGGFSWALVRFVVRHACIVPTGGSRRRHEPAPGDEAAIVRSARDGQRLVGDAARRRCKAPHANAAETAATERASRDPRSAAPDFQAVVISAA